MAAPILDLLCQYYQDFVEFIKQTSSNSEKLKTRTIN